MADGWNKNMDVAKKELCLYKEVVLVQWERVKAEPNWRRKLHILSGLEVDAHRVVPRTLVYLNRGAWFLVGALLGIWILS